MLALTTNRNLAPQGGAGGACPKTRARNLSKKVFGLRTNSRVDECTLQRPVLLLPPKSKLNHFDVIGVIFMGPGSGTPGPLKLEPERGKKKSNHLVVWLQVYKSLMKQLGSTQQSPPHGRSRCPYDETFDPRAESGAEFQLERLCVVRPRERSASLSSQARVAVLQLDIGWGTDGDCQTRQIMAVGWCS